jgi:hypothetical protein
VIFILLLLLLLLLTLLLLKSLVALFSTAGSRTSAGAPISSWTGCSGSGRSGLLAMVFARMMHSTSGQRLALR